jgi:hypothetical protein
MSAAKNFFGKVALKLQNLRERGIQHECVRPMVVQPAPKPRPVDSQSPDYSVAPPYGLSSLPGIAVMGFHSGFSKPIIIVFLVPVPLIVLFNLRG